MQDAIYCDYNATWPIQQNHFNELGMKIHKINANPSSAHSLGRRAKAAIEDVRHQFAKKIGSQAQQLVFTSSATEANNWIIFNFSQKKTNSSTKPLLVCSRIEHSSIMQPLKFLYNRNSIDFQTISVNSLGFVNFSHAKKILASHPKLICILFAHHEVGTIQHLETFVEMVKSHDKNIHIHVDAVQALGKHPISWFGESSIDSATFSSHKIGGLKGLGVLYQKNSDSLSPLLFGGGQERKQRAGTENLAGILSFGLALESIDELFFLPVIRQIRHHLLEELIKIPYLSLHGDYENGLPNTLHFHIDNVRGEDILINFDLQGIYASSGSACSSHIARPSQTLIAMGYNSKIALNSVRLSFGPELTFDHVTRITNILKICQKEGERI